MATKIGALGTLLCGSTGAVISTGCYLQITSSSKKSENPEENTTPATTDQPEVSRVAEAEPSAAPEVEREEESRVDGETEDKPTETRNDNPVSQVPPEAGKATEQSNETVEKVEPTATEPKVEASLKQIPIVTPVKTVPDNAKEEKPSSTCTRWYLTWWC